MTRTDISKVFHAMREIERVVHEAGGSNAANIRLRKISLAIRDEMSADKVVDLIARWGVVIEDACSGRI